KYLAACGDRRRTAVNRMGKLLGPTVPEPISTRDSDKFAIRSILRNRSLADRRPRYIGSGHDEPAYSSLATLVARFLSAAPSYHLDLGRCFGGLVYPITFHPTEAAALYERV